MGRKASSAASRPAAGGAASPHGDPARDAALALLARRDHGEEELRRKLLRKGYAPGDADRAVAALRALGLLDDGKLLPRLVRHYSETRGYGRAKVAAALRARGFEAGAVEGALRTAFPVEAEAEGACAALRKKYRGGLPPGREGAARAFRFLAGRGFSPSACRTALGRARAGADLEPDEGES